MDSFSVSVLSGGIVGLFVASFSICAALEKIARNLDEISTNTKAIKIELNRLNELNLNIKLLDITLSKLLDLATKKLSVF